MGATGALAGPCTLAAYTVVDVSNRGVRIDIQDDAQIDIFDQVDPPLKYLDLGDHALIAVPFFGQIVLAPGQPDPSRHQFADCDLVEFADDGLHGSDQIA